MLATLTPPIKRGGTLLIKYGGNAMTNESIRDAVIQELRKLYQSGVRIILVHGGGPEINKLLKTAGVESEFVEGHRKTTREVMGYVQMALRGEVNGALVKLMNAAELPAVGLSGKDGGMIRAKKRMHRSENKTGGGFTETDIGYVGNIEHINTDLIELLMNENFIPVLAPIALGDDGEDYNINADIFAGAVAAAVKVDAYVSLTDVDGLYRDIHNPESRIDEASVDELKEFMRTVASGGMLPKLESIIAALEGGVKEAHIVNGTKPDLLIHQLTGKSSIGTRITV